MWTLTHIKATNLCAFQELSWDLPQHIATVVFGNNMDNDSQNSNGSGKSALVESIAVGLTGDPLRKAKTDEIIRDDADQCSIEVDLVNTDGRTLKIERLLSRKKPQAITLTLNGESLVQATVNDYNKYILDSLGISRDDIYSNFILSKDKYVSFLSSSDREKKELINRFSNGDLVDVSIDALHADMEPLKAKLLDAEKDVSYQQGTISTLDDQIGALMAESNNAASKKAERLADIDRQIADARRQIREANTTIDSLNQDWDDIEGIEKSINKIEDADASFEDTYKRICSIWQDSLLGKLTDYNSFLADMRKEIERLSHDEEESTKLIGDYQNDIARAEADVRDANTAYDKLVEKNDKQSKRLQESTKQSRAAIEQANKSLQNLTERKRKVEESLGNLMKLLAGTIECPNCHHQWSLESELSIEELQSEYDQAEKSQREITTDIENRNEDINVAQRQIRSNNAEATKLDDTLTSKSNEVMNAKRKLNNIKHTLQTLNDDIKATQQKMENIHKRIASTRDALLNEVYDAIDNAIKRLDSQIKAEQNKIKALEGSIDALTASRKQVDEYSVDEALKPLQEARKKAEQKYNACVEAKEDLDARYNALVVQESRFIEFKTYLANSKVEALSAMTNMFLEAIGSDIRIAFSGITVLKTGKVRDKISISLLRDGIDCGSFGKFSQGERSRCELATILALQKLINVNCEEGKGLDLLVIDEVMDGTDENGLSSICDTLNNLQVTSLIVTHGHIHESYQHRLVVNKQNGVSFI